MVSNSAEGALLIYVRSPYLRNTYVRVQEASRTGNFTTLLNANEITYLYSTKIKAERTL